MSIAFVGKAYLIGSIGPEDGFLIVSPRIRVFDDEEKSVVELLDLGWFLRCLCLFGLLKLVAEAFLGPGAALSGGHASCILFGFEIDHLTVHEGFKGVRP